MQTTARALVTGALKTLKVLPAGVSLSPEDAADGLEVLKEMIDAWNTQAFTVPTLSRQVYPLTSGVNSYTIGPGGTFNTDLPNDIEDAGLVNNYGASNEFELPVHVMTDDEYKSLVVKTLADNWPRALRYEKDAPTGTIILWPTPNVASLNLALYLPADLSSFADLDTALYFTKGVIRALRYNLAKELSANYQGSWSPDLEAKAVESLATVKVSNFRINPLRCDTAVTRSGARTWDVRSGDFFRR